MISTLAIAALGLVSFVNAAAPHDAGMAMNQGRMHRMARSRRGRALAAPKREVVVAKRAEECALQVSASDAAKWSSFVGQGLRECTSSSADLQAGIAMCYRLGFVDTQSGTFGGELTVWNIQGSSSTAASASSKDPNANITSTLAASASATASRSSSISASASSESRSSVSATSSRAAAATEVVSNLNATATGSAAAIRMLRRAKGDEQSFAVTMKIGDADYKTSQIRLVAAGSGSARSAGASKNGTTISLANLQFASKGMELLQSFHFVGQLPESSTKTRRQANDINRDLSFGAANSSETKESSASARVRASATSSAAITTVTGKSSAGETASPISAQVINSLAPALKVLASGAVANQMGNPTVIDLSQESAAQKGFATEAFGAFKSLARIDQSGNDGTTTLVSDSDCSLVIGGDDSTGAVGGVFTTTDFGSFFSTASAASSTASSTASSVASAATTSKASAKSSASASASASSSVSASASASASSSRAATSAATSSAAASTASSASAAAQGNPSSGPGIQVISTGAIAASDASAIQATATAAAVTSSDPAPTPEAQPTSAAPEGDDSSDESGDAASQAATSTSAADPSASLANAEAADPSPTAFQLPGRSISVLPIGLGVFGGVSAVALVIVAWVTYERRKYKRMFADRSAAQAAPRRSGYGTV